MIFVCRYSRVHVAFSDSRESKSYKYLKWTHLTPCSYQSPKQQILEETRMNQVTSIMHRSNISGDNEIAQGENDHRLWGMWGSGHLLGCHASIVTQRLTQPKKYVYKFPWQLAAGCAIEEVMCIYRVYVCTHVFWSCTHWLIRKCWSLLSRWSCTNKELRWPSYLWLCLTSISIHDWLNEFKMTHSPNFWLSQSYEVYPL